jgi:hypothetical protein
MYAIHCPVLGYFTGYQLRNNQMQPIWAKNNTNFSLAIFHSASEALETAEKLEAIAYSLNQLPQS